MQFFLQQVLNLNSEFPYKNITNFLGLYWRLKETS